MDRIIFELSLDGEFTNYYEPREKDTQVFVAYQKDAFGRFYLLLQYGDGNIWNQTNFGNLAVEVLDSLWRPYSYWEIKSPYQVAGQQGGLVLTDSSIIVGSAHGTSFDRHHFDNQMPAVYELNFNGKILWSFEESQGLDHPFNTITDIHLAEDGSLYALANRFLFIDTLELDPVHQPFSIYNQRASLYKWDKNRNMVYHRVLRSRLTGGFMSETRPHQMIVNKKGEVLILGHLIPDNIPGEIFALQGWLAKTDSNGCIDGEPCIDGRWLSAYQEPQILEPKSNSFVYPNPNNGIVFLNMSDVSGNRAEIYNTNGILVFETLLNYNSFELPAHLPNAMYLIRLHSKNEIHQSKFILKR